MQKSRDSQDPWSSRNQKYLKTVNLFIVLSVEYWSFLGMKVQGESSFSGCTP